MAPLARLARRADFVRVAAGRRKWVTPGLVLQACPGLGSPEVRVGFTASRKVGNAVARNRARRRLRAVSAAVMAVHAREGQDYVLIARPGTLTRCYQELIEDLEESLKQLGFYHA
jgi:ribonuclease P protein component